MGAPDRDRAAAQRLSAPPAAPSLAEAVPVWLRVAALSFGEGWHNNHHAHPTSARHGLAWYEFDLNWIMISLMRMFGLAWDIKVAKIKQPVSYEENDTLIVDEATA